MKIVPLTDSFQVEKYLKSVVPTETHDFSEPGRKRAFYFCLHRRVWHLLFPECLFIHAPRLLALGTPPLVWRFLWLAIALSRMFTLFFHINEQWNRDSIHVSCSHPIHHLNCLKLSWDGKLTKTIPHKTRNDWNSHLSTVIALKNHPNPVPLSPSQLISLFWRIKRTDTFLSLDSSKNLLRGCINSLHSFIKCLVSTHARPSSLILMRGSDPQMNYMWCAAWTRECQLQLRKYNPRPPLVRARRS